MKNIWKSTKILADRLLVAAMLVLFSLGAHAQNLSLPLGVAVDANGNIYVASLFNGVTVYGPKFAKKATITQGLDGASSVAIGPDGTIYVANNLGNSVSEYYANGYAQKSVTIPVNQPTQVLVGSYNEIYVVQDNGTVSMFDPLGELRSQVTVVNTETLVITPELAQFWVANEFSNPSAFVYELFTIDVATNPNGFQAAGPYNGFLPTRAVANLTTGDTWITDLINQHVLQVDANGNATVRITPEKPPYGIALDTTKQRIYVTEPEANQVEVFSLSTLQRIGLLR
jgi:hypothetical protein